MTNEEYRDISNRLHRILEDLEAGAGGRMYHEKKDQPEGVYERLALLEVAAKAMRNQRDYSQRQIRDQEKRLRRLEKRFEETDSDPEE
jgi:type IV secretory pathway ATPase VirB11/archaellum biosynthesis ATPase